ncbi:MAG: hypothetical protein GXP49_18215, partial [Deltaproteobacteria bacterium]|nr:hypothetical protein [Deltaproteobacteria bacterium]
RERAELQSKYDLLTADRDRLLFFLDQAEERLKKGEHEKARLYEKLYKVESELDRIKYSKEAVQKGLEAELESTHTNLDVLKEQIAKLLEEKYKVEIERDETRADLEKKLEALQLVVKEREKRLADIYASKSWRLLKSMKIVR